MDLNTIWFLLVGVLIIGYAILDGFDLGVGSLYYLLGKTPEEKGVLLNSIGPVWDANEVWLLTGGGALFAAFPIVYASVFSGFYLAMMLVVFGLIFRAVALEFRSKDEMPGWQRKWDALFFAGSLVPALLFGVAVGNVAEGLPLDAAQNYTGGFFHLLNPYALLIGLVGLFAFLNQGVTYTLCKTDGEIFARAKKLAGRIWFVFLVLYILASLYSLLAAPSLFDNYSKHYLLFLVPVLTWAGIIAMPFARGKERYGLSFLFSSVSFAGMILTLAAGLFPKLVPATNPAFSLTIYNSASSPLTLKVMLVIALIGVPVVLLYTSYVYRVFKGKIKQETGVY